MEPRAYSRAPVGDERLFFVPPLGLDLCGTCGRYYGQTPARLVECPHDVPQDSVLHLDCLCSSCPGCGLTLSRGGPRLIWDDRDNGVYLWGCVGLPVGSRPCPRCGTWPGKPVRAADEAMRLARAWTRSVAGFIPPEYRVYRVDTLEDLQVCAPSVYNLPDEDLAQMWIAYFDRQDFVIRESLILLIDRRTGEYIYYGGASDEG